MYISGNLTGPFTEYLENPSPEFKWEKALKYPKPDYLSSSRKRLIPQIIAKGSILNQWHKKQAIALQVGFYETLPMFPEVKREQSDFALILYDLVESADKKKLSLTLKRVVYTTFKSALEIIAHYEAGPIEYFTEILQKKLDAKISGNPTLDTDNIVIE